MKTFKSLPTTKLISPPQEKPLITEIPKPIEQPPIPINNTHQNISNSSINEPINVKPEVPKAQAPKTAAQPKTSISEPLNASNIIKSQVLESQIKPTTTAIVQHK